jgi:hypothetical protein
VRHSPQLLVTSAIAIPQLEGLLQLHILPLKIMLLRNCISAYSYHSFSTSVHNFLKKCCSATAYPPIAEVQTKKVACL